MGGWVGRPRGARAEGWGLGGAGCAVEAHGVGDGGGGGDLHGSGCSTCLGLRWGSYGVASDATASGESRPPAAYVSFASLPARAFSPLGCGL